MQAQKNQGGRGNEMDSEKRRERRFIDDLGREGVALGRKPLPGSGKTYKEDKKLKPGRPSPENPRGKKKKKDRGGM